MHYSQIFCSSYSSAIGLVLASFSFMQKRSQNTQRVILDSIYTYDMSDDICCWITDLTEALDNQMPMFLIVSLMCSASARDNVLQSSLSQDAVSLCKQDGVWIILSEILENHASEMLSHFKYLT